MRVIRTGMELILMLTGILGFILMCCEADSFKTQVEIMTAGLVIMLLSIVCVGLLEQIK